MLCKPAFAYFEISIKHMLRYVSPRFSFLYRYYIWLKRVPDVPIERNPTFNWILIDHIDHTLSTYSLYSPDTPMLLEKTILIPSLIILAAVCLNCVTLNPQPKVNPRPLQLKLWPRGYSLLESLLKNCWIASVFLLWYLLSSDDRGDCIITVSLATNAERCIPGLQS